MNNQSIIVFCSASASVSEDEDSKTSGKTISRTDSDIKVEDCVTHNDQDFVESSTQEAVPGVSTKPLIV